MFFAPCLMNMAHYPTKQDKSLNKSKQMACIENNIQCMKTSLGNMSHHYDIFMFPLVSIISGLLSFVRDSLFLLINI